MSRQGDLKLHLVEEDPKANVIELRERRTANLIRVRPDFIVSSEEILSTRPATTTEGGPLVMKLVLTAEAGDRLRRATSTHMGGKLAFVLDGEVVSAPTITEPLAYSVVMPGRFSMDEAQDLSRTVSRLFRYPVRVDIPKKGLPTPDASELTINDLIPLPGELPASIALVESRAFTEGDILAMRGFLKAGKLLGSLFEDKKKDGESLSKGFDVFDKEIMRQLKRGGVFKFSERARLKVTVHEFRSSEACERAFDLHRSRGRKESTGRSMIFRADRFFLSVEDEGLTWMGAEAFEKALIKRLRAVSADVKLERSPGQPIREGK